MGQLPGKFEVLTGKSLAWPDTFLLNEKYFNWKFIAEYGTSYFIILAHNTTPKRALLSQFRFFHF